MCKKCPDESKGQWQCLNCEYIHALLEAFDKAPKGHEHCLHASAILGLSYNYIMERPVVTQEDEPDEFRKMTENEYRLHLDFLKEDFSTCFLPECPQCRSQNTKERFILDFQLEQLEICAKDVYTSKRYCYQDEYYGEHKRDLVCMDCGHWGDYKDFEPAEGLLRYHNKCECGEQEHQLLSHDWETGEMHVKCKSCGKKRSINDEVIH